VKAFSQSYVIIYPHDEHGTETVAKDSILTYLRNVNSLNDNTSLLFQEHIY